MEQRLGNAEGHTAPPLFSQLTDPGPLHCRGAPWTPGEGRGSVVPKILERARRPVRDGKSFSGILKGHEAFGRRGDFAESYFSCQGGPRLGRWADTPRNSDHGRAAQSGHTAPQTQSWGLQAEPVRPLHLTPPGAQPRGDGPRAPAPSGLLSLDLTLLLCSAHTEGPPCSDPCGQDGQLQCLPAQQAQRAPQRGAGADGRCPQDLG